MATYVNKTGSEKPLITYEELSKHTSRGDAWIVIRGRVIDATPYLAEHPGGEDILLANAGTDCTEEFNNKEGEGHTDYAFSLSDKFWVGNLDYDSPKVLVTKSAEAKRKMYSYQEVARHNKDDDCWIIYKGQVFDVTNFLNEHPGGPLLITDYAGKDATRPFDEQDHSKSATLMLESYLLGNLDTTTVPVHKQEAKTGGSNPIVLVIAIGLVLAVFYMLYVQNN